jgi:hypothetical protein
LIEEPFGRKADVYGKSDSALSMKISQAIEF